MCLLSEDSWSFRSLSFYQGFGEPSRLSSVPTVLDLPDARDTTVSRSVDGHSPGLCPGTFVGKPASF